MNKLTKTKNDIKIKTDIKNCAICKDRFLQLAYALEGIIKNELLTDNFKENWQHLSIWYNECEIIDDLNFEEEDADWHSDYSNAVTINIKNNLTTFDIVFGSTIKISILFETYALFDLPEGDVDYSFTTTLHRLHWLSRHCRPVEGEEVYLIEAAFKDKEDIRERRNDGLTEGMILAYCSSLDILDFNNHKDKIANEARLGFITKESIGKRNSYESKEFKNLEINYEKISKKLHSAIEKEIRFLRFDIKISKNDKQVYYLDHRDQRIIFTRL